MSRRPIRKPFGVVRDGRKGVPRSAVIGRRQREAPPVVAAEDLHIECRRCAHRRPRGIDNQYADCAVFLEVRPPGWIEDGKCLAHIPEDVA